MCSVDRLTYHRTQLINLTSNRTICQMPSPCPLTFRVSSIKHLTLIHFPSPFLYPNIQHQIPTRHIPSFGGAWGGTTFSLYFCFRRAWGDRPSLLQIPYCLVWNTHFNPYFLTLLCSICTPPGTSPPLEGLGEALPFILFCPHFL